MSTLVYQKEPQLMNGHNYIADQPKYDFTPNDAVLTAEDDYLAPSTASKDALSVVFLMKNLHDVTLDFGGAKLVFHGRIVPFILDQCENVTIKNCSIDYDRTFYTEANILEADTGRIRIKIKDGFPYRVEGGYLIAESEYWENHLNYNNLLFQLYDPVTHTPAPLEIILALIGREIHPHPNLPLPVHQLTAEQDGDMVILTGEFPESWKAGYDLVITHESRDKNTFTAVGCKNITLENVRIIHGASLGFVGMHSENITFRNFSMFRDDEHLRLVTNNADSIHCFNCSGHILLDGCRMDGMLDDALNVHANFTLADHTEQNILIAYNASRDVSIRNKIYLPGDTIAIYHGATMEEKARYRIKTVSTDKNNMYILELYEVPEDIEKGDMIENLSGQADITIRNCHFGKFRGTMRLQSRGKILIESCTFEGTGADIMFTGDAVYWFESSPVRDVLIQNCTFAGSLEMRPEIRATEAAPYYHENITVKNCAFIGGCVVNAQYTKGITFIDNRSDSPMMIRTKNCANIVTDNAVLIDE